MVLLFACRNHAQLSGTYNVPTDFNTIAAAIASLNTAGVNGPVTIDVTAGHTETASVGGYSLFAISGASSINQIIFQKSGVGSNPLITAYTGTATPSSVAQDGVWRLIGADYITIDGIDITDPNASNPATMEFGYGLFKASTGDGCQYNTIRNCNITLQRMNNAAGSGPATDGSRGIDVVNALSNAHTTAVTPNAAAGTNSYNKFYGNTIQNCNIGIAMIGYAAPSPFTLADMGNDIGGNSISTGNTIYNFGGGGTTASAGIRTLAQYGVNVAYNVLNSNTGTGTNHPGVIRGIYLNTATSANATINSNTITLKGGGTSQGLTPIENISGATAANNAINITNNLVTGCTYVTATSGLFYGIYSSASAATVNITGNSVSNNSTNTGSGNCYAIYNSGSVTSSLTISNNFINGFTLSAASASSPLRLIYNTGAANTSSLSIHNNTLQGVTYLGNGSGAFSGIYNSAAALNQSISNNIFNNISINTTGTGYILYCSNTLPANGVRSIIGNSVVTGFSKTLVGGDLFGYFSNGASPATATEYNLNNNFSNLNVTGLTGIYAWQSTDGSATAPYGSTKTIAGNTFTALTGGTDFVVGLLAGFSNTNAVNTISNNLISDVTCPCAITGIQLTQGGHQVVENSIHSFTSTTNKDIFGIYTSSGVLNTISKNKIYDFEGTDAASRVIGVNITAASNVIANNMIGDLRAPNANVDNSVIGISVAGTSSMDIYFNTVYLNASSSGTDFGSSAIATSTSVVVNLRNNIFLNNSVPSGSGLTVAYRRLGTSLTSYANSSDNNLFYAGLPGSSQVIFYDGTNTYQTLNAYQSAVAPRDAASITENTPFLSTLGSNPNFLHVNPNQLSLTESAGTNIVGFETDFDNQVRQGNPGYTGTGTAPDIGADEFEQQLPACSGASPAVINYSSPNGCEGKSLFMSANNFIAGQGITYEWQVSSTSGGPYTLLPGGSGDNNVSHTTGTLSAGVYYFVMVTTCSVGPVSAVSNELSYTVHANPSATAATSASVVCIGDDIHLLGSSDTGTTYEWLGPNAYTSALQNATIPMVNTNASGAYSLITTSNGCDSEISTVSVVVSNPTLTISNSSHFLCLGSNATLTAMSADAVTYAWNGSSATTSAIVVNPAVNTAYSATITNAHSCSVAATASITIMTLTISGSDAAVCPGVTGTLNAMAATSPSINWYLTPGSPTAVATGTAFTISSPTTTTVFAQSSTGGTGSLHTTMANNNGSAGNMFDIVPNTNLIFTGVDMHFATVGTTTVEVWYRQGSFVGFETSSAGWTLAHTTTVTTIASGTLTPIPGSFAILMEAGQTYGIYVTSVNGSPGTRYQNGTTLGTLYASNADLNFYEGKGGAYFASTISPRIFNGNLYYTKPVCSSSMAPITLSVHPTPILNVSATSTMICSGESPTLNASGLDTYVWSENSLTTSSISVSPNVNTTYSVTGTDALTGCSTMDSVNIAVKPSPVVSLTQSADTVCAHSPVTFSVTGAGTYTWNTNSNDSVYVVNPTSTSIYTVSGTQTNGCSSSATVGVVTNSLPVVSIAQSQTSICIPGTVAFTVTGANSYSWNTGSTNSVISINPTSLTVVYVDGTDTTGCFSSASATVNAFVSPTVQITPASAQMCFGSVASFTASGADTYNWNTGSNSSVFTVTILSNSSYSVIGTNVQGCNATNVVSVAAMPLPNVSLTASNPTVCVDEPVTLTASGAVTYTLMPVNQSGDTLTVNPSENTTYTVIGTDVNGCTNKASLEVSVDPCLGIEESRSADLFLSIYPNPSNGFITLDFGNSGNKNILVTNAVGAIVYQASTSEQTQVLDLSFAAKGIYFVKITSGALTGNYRIVIQ